ncbi:MAG: helix-turn-helix domain-containing protein [Patescibacteria group bacterium]
MQKELQLLGLTENEAIVYEALVSLGPCKAGALIARLDLHRTIIYRCLESMSTNGFITKIVQNGVWHFQIADPQSFLISSQRKEIILAELSKIISERQERVSSQIVVYEGVASYRNYWLHSVERLPDETVDYIAGGDMERWSEIMGKYEKEYLRAIKKKRMSWRSLHFKPLTSIEIKKLSGAGIPTECRVWEPVDQNFFGNFNVLGDTVILHTPSENPKIIEMRDRAQVKMFQSFFDLMWVHAKPVSLT